MMYFLYVGLVMEYLKLKFMEALEMTTLSKEKTSSHA